MRNILKIGCQSATVCYNKNSEIKIYDCRKVKVYYVRVLIVGRVKNEPETRVVCHVKSSLAPEGKSIAFRLDKENGFEWIGEYDISADDLLSGNNRGQKIKEAKEFLLEILADGAVEQNVILKEAENRGIKGKTLWNAKKALGVQSIKPGGHWSWVLPEQ